MGHLIGLAAGFFAVWLFGAESTPSVIASKHLTSARMWATVLAVALNMLGGLLLHASHPPAAATTLLVALGGFKTTTHDARTVIAGVVIIATVGEMLRRARLGKAELEELSHGDRN